MDILDTDYSDEKHVFAYDNATIHTARPPASLSAKQMPANPNANFFCTVKDKEGKTTDVKMKDGKFKDGTPQQLYYPANHPKYPGFFKGTRALIQERRNKGHDLPDP